MSRRHVYYYTHVPVGFEEATGMLAGSPAGWLPGSATWDGAGWRTQLRAEGALPGPVATQVIRAEVGVPTRSGEQESSRLLLAIAWRAATAEAWFPVLEGEIELTQLVGERCQLALWGSYRPPLSVLGEAGDRLLGRRIAEACARRFVLDIADRLVRLDCGRDQRAGTPGRAG